MQQDVPGFVRQGLHGLGVVDVAAHGDGALGVVGDAVGPADPGRPGAASDREPAGGDGAGQGVPQPGRGLAGQQLRAGRGRQRVPVGLGHVEHRRGPEPDDRPAAPRGGRVLLAGGLVAAGDVLLAAGAPGGDRGQHPQALLPLADLPAHRLPGAVPGDQGGVRVLRGDQDLVAEAVGVEPRRGVQPAPPRLPVADRGDPGGELAVQRLQAFGAGGLGGGPLPGAAVPPPAGLSGAHRRIRAGR